MDTTKKAQPAIIIDKWGGSSTDVLEEEFKKSTVGLVSKEEYRKNKETYLTLLAQSFKQAEEARLKSAASEQSKPKVKKTKKALLSFDDEEQEEDNIGSKKQNGREDTRKDDEQNGDNVVKKAKIGKNPAVDTSFLPDDERDQKFADMKKQWMDDYNKDQDIIRNQTLEVKYMYWDGSNQVKSIQMIKDTKIGYFLDACKRELSKEYPMLKNVPTEGLMCVQQDFILPHSVSFYEILSVKPDTGRGVLMDDKKKEIPPDSELQEGEKEEEVYEMLGNPIKIVDKKWYEKHKHIYPSSTWETLDLVKFLK